MGGFLADLHNHSCLSPCASLEQSPALLARLARERGLAILALTDHNSALNCPAFAECCLREGVVPLFGLEVCSLEEVHVLCIFGGARRALEFGDYIRGLLPPLPYDPEKLGDEVVVDADEAVLELPDYFLGGAAEIDFGGLCEAAASRGALVIPAHVDRPAFSVASQLGFLPPGPYDAIESMREPAPELRGGLPAISGSDAHYPEHIARRPFRVELAQELLRDRLAAGAGLDASSARAESAGDMLLAALRKAFVENRALPSWAVRG